MKLLLKATRLVRRHRFFCLIAILTLLGMTFASQMERFAIGLLLDSEAVSSPIRHPELSPVMEVMRTIRDTFGIEQNVRAYLIFLCGVALFNAFFLFFSRYTTRVLAIRLSAELRERYFEHIQRLPMSFYREHSNGAISSRIAVDAEQIAISFNSLLINYVQSPFTIVTTLLACCTLSWRLALVIFVGFPLIIIPIVWITRKVKKTTRQLQRNQEKFTSVLIDFLAGIQTVKIFAMEGFSFKKYKQQNDRMERLEKKTAKYDLLTRPILHTVMMTCLIITAVIGLRVLHMSISQLAIFIGLLHLCYDPIKKFAEENTSIQKGVVAAERLFEVLEIRSRICDHPEAIELKSFEKHIEFDGVWFRYQKEWVLKDLSFTVRKGESVALVGETGVGKSTIVQLLPRLYDVQKGEIRIDGIPLQGYTQRSLREQMAFVPQKPFLFYDTIASNISYGRPIVDAKVVEAAKKAHAHEFIALLPEQYRTLLAETGQTFSGGQQQRLAIARALFKDAPILILDEATSALDAISEEKIKGAIHKLRRRVTQILIAHRLGTVEHADRIIYLNAGRKIAEGSKEELLVTCPDFKKLWDLHFKTTG
ncbi:MAG: ABC transporter ATP-binding protein [Simkaniaceae bacterium]|nr:ABC transporter ATP-binding protein [Simkaniaceae bacterium]